MILKGLFGKPKNKLERGGESGVAPFAPDGLYIRCVNCKKSILTGDMAQNLQVCPECGRHFRIGARERINIICDKGTFVETDSDVAPKDVISFPDYERKITEAQKCGETEAVVTGTGKVGGIKTAVFVMESRFMMGSMGSGVGEKIARLFELAIKEQLPVIGFTLSGGARMQEGIISLMQMAKTSAAIKRHSDAGLLYIVVLTDPTTGGVTASFATLGDIILAEPGALIGFAGPRVIEQTIRQKLPPGFQKSEFLLKTGFVDAIVPRKEQKEKLAYLLTMQNA
ncbi:MAG: acetyl-CoA carboxylase, carboxyltransferase subunit beta [Firmicutes bacterium]|nr:acetyl-CoA carboxylase, carboxyltransferase subunit beta [Bacillota bacterium]